MNNIHLGSPSNSIIANIDKRINGKILSDTVSSCYQVCESKGATMPSDRSPQNLSSCIQSITGKLELCYNGQSFLTDTTHPFNQSILSVDSSDLIGYNKTINFPKCKYFKSYVNKHIIDSAYFSLQEGLIIDNIIIPSAEYIEISSSPIVMPTINNVTAKYFKLVSTSSGYERYGNLTVDLPVCKTIIINGIYNLVLSDLSECDGLSVTACGGSSYEFPFSCPNNTLTLPKLAYENMYIPMYLDTPDSISIQNLIVPLWTNRDQIINWITGMCSPYYGSRRDVMTVTYDNGTKKLKVSIVEDPEMHEGAWQFTDL